MARRQPDREFVAPVAKVRLRYAKRGRLRFSSSRDFQRALERALRRANVPMAYSAGFNPHPKISYANAVPTGVASEAEYLEIGVAAAVDVDQLRRDLDAALPAGLDILEAVVAAPPDLAARLQASVWQIALPQVDLEAAQSAAAALMGSESVEVQRMMKSGLRIWDVRPSIRSIDVRLDSEGVDRCAILTVVVAHGTPSVRPDDVLAALRQVADLVPPVPARVVRLAQGPLAVDARTVSDPLAPEDTVGA
ncbi:MAG: TIGR03936 family radical SAM-associated protein [Actinomycetes bacterium]